MTWKALVFLASILKSTRELLNITLSSDKNGTTYLDSRKRDLRLFSCLLYFVVIAATNVSSNQQKFFKRLYWPWTLKALSFQSVFCFDLCCGIIFLEKLKFQRLFLRHICSVECSYLHWKKFQKWFCCDTKASTILRYKTAF